MNKNKAFTLVELIVVITILAIIGTIAFISLQGYSANSRDSVRISDVNMMKISLELFSLGAGKYPMVDNKTEVTYSGDLLRTQGTIGDNVTINLSKSLKKKPLDPLKGFEYTYSVTESQKEYEILTIYEERNTFGYNKIFTDTYAYKQDYQKIDGNYNGVAVKTSKHIVPSPSIINAEFPTNNKIDLNSTTINSQIITGGNNGINNSTGDLDISTFEVYEIPEGGVINKSDLANSIKNTYNGTSLGNNGIIANIVNTSDSKKLETLIANTVLSISNYTPNDYINCASGSIIGETYTNVNYIFDDISHGESGQGSGTINITNGTQEFFVNLECINGKISIVTESEGNLTCDNNYIQNGNSCEEISKEVKILSSESGLGYNIMTYIPANLTVNEGWTGGSNDPLLHGYQAYNYCNDLTLLGYSNWTLPTITELNALYLNNDKIGYSGTSSVYPYSQYRSQTKYTDNTHRLFKDLNTGTQRDEYYANSFYSRCIRTY